MGDITLTTELLYQQKPEAYESVSMLVGQVDSLVKLLYEQRKNGNIAEFDGQRLVTILSDVMHAMERHDTVAMADVLEYDLKEFLQELVQCGG